MIQLLLPFETIAESRQKFHDLIDFEDTLADALGCLTPAEYRELHQQTLAETAPCLRCHATLIALKMWHRVEGFLRKKRKFL